jgi:hypothetical protein
MLIIWSFKRFTNIPIFVDNDEAFACLGEATYICYTAATLPVANYQGDEEDVHIVQYTGTKPSRKFKLAQNDSLFLQPNWYVEGNFALTWGRIFSTCYNFDTRSDPSTFWPVDSAGNTSGK